ncbi:hypothetical protein Q0N12_15630 [Rossellomorea marisflavi]|uniref:hypothetical protein n=1 Tax=Rossellomorea marisflavi TaxID=189381 RepID=UPI00345773E0
MGRKAFFAFLRSLNLALFASSDITKNEQIKLFDLQKQDFMDNEDADMKGANSTIRETHFKEGYKKTAIPIRNDCIPYSNKAKVNGTIMTGSEKA